MVLDALSRWPAEQGIGWPSWAFENHDAPRAVSRWAGDIDAHAYCRMKMLLLACLRGNIFLYYGEELGLPQVEIGFEDLRDPEAIANWPLTLSRDGARTPMPWTRAAPWLGFSDVKPWLPVGEAHRPLAVDVQESEPNSLLHWTREVLALRNATPPLRRGTIHFLDTPGDLLAFERTQDGQQCLCVFNLSTDPISWRPADAGRWRVDLSTGSIADWNFAPASGLVATFQV